MKHRFVRIRIWCKKRKAYINMAECRRCPDRPEFLPDSDFECRFHDAG